MKAPGQRPSGFHICDILDMPEGRNAGGASAGVGGHHLSPQEASVPQTSQSFTTDRPLHMPWTLHPDHGSNYIKLYFVSL